MRLQKYLADCGVASRRKSEELISQGRVRVNGEPTVDLTLLAEPHARNANRQSCRRFLLVPHAA